MSACENAQGFCRTHFRPMDKDADKCDHVTKKLPSNRSELEIAAEGATIPDLQCENENCSNVASFGPFRGKWLCGRCMDGVVRSDAESEIEDINKTLSKAISYVCSHCGEMSKPHPSRAFALVGLHSHFDTAHPTAPFGGAFVNTPKNLVYHDPKLPNPVRKAHKDDCLDCGERVPKNEPYYSCDRGCGADHLCADCYDENHADGDCEQWPEDVAYNRIYYDPSVPHGVSKEDAPSHCPHCEKVIGQKTRVNGGWFGPTICKHRGKDWTTPPENKIVRDDFIDPNRSVEKHTAGHPPKDSWKNKPRAPSTEGPRPESQEIQSTKPAKPVDASLLSDRMGVKDPRARQYVNDIITRKLEALQARTRKHEPIVNQTIENLKSMYPMTPAPRHGNEREAYVGELDGKPFRVSHYGSFASIDMSYGPVRSGNLQHYMGERGIASATFSPEAGTHWTYNVRAPKAHHGCKHCLHARPTTEANDIIAHLAGQEGHFAQYNPDYKQPPPDNIDRVWGTWDTAPEGWHDLEDSKKVIRKSATMPCAKCGTILPRKLNQECHACGWVQDIPCDVCGKHPAQDVSEHEGVDLTCDDCENALHEALRDPDTLPCPDCGYWAKVHKNGKCPEFKLQEHLEPEIAQDISDEDRDFYKSLDDDAALAEMARRFKLSKAHSHRSLVDAFANGATEGRSSSMHIRRAPDGGTFLTSYNWAVIAHRGRDGKITQYPDWSGYSVTTTSKHMNGLWRLGGEQARGRPSTDSWPRSYDNRTWREKVGPRGGRYGIKPHPVERGDSKYQCTRCDTPTRRESSIPGVCPSCSRAYRRIAEPPSLSLRPTRRTGHRVAPYGRPLSRPYTPSPVGLGTDISGTSWNTPLEQQTGVDMTPYDPMRLIGERRAARAAQPKPEGEEEKRAAFRARLFAPPKTEEPVKETAEQVRQRLDAQMPSTKDEDKEDDIL